MVRETVQKREEIIAVSHLRHISDKMYNVKASPNKPLHLTASSVCSSVAPASGRR
jgi:hypothetical protein